VPNEKNGKPKWGYVRLPGVKVKGERVEGPVEHHPEGAYHLNFRESGQRKCPTVFQGFVHGKEQSGERRNRQIILP
jgi:hypothetical protein